MNKTSEQLKILLRKEKRNKRKVSTILSDSYVISQVEITTTCMNLFPYTYNIEK